MVLSSYLHQFPSGVKKQISRKYKIDPRSFAFFAGRDPLADGDCSANCASLLSYCGDHSRRTCLPSDVSLHVVTLTPIILTVSWYDLSTRVQVHQHDYFLILIQRAVYLLHVPPIHSNSFLLTHNQTLLFSRPANTPGNLIHGALVIVVSSYPHSDVFCTECQPDPHVFFSSSGQKFSISNRQIKNNTTDKS